MQLPNRQTRYRMMDMYRFNKDVYGKLSSSLLCINDFKDIPFRRRRESPLSSIGKELLTRAPLVLSAMSFGLLDLNELRKYSFGRQR